MEWRMIPSFPDYEASSEGALRRRTLGRLTWPGRSISTAPIRNGYRAAQMRTAHGKKTLQSVHRLVAEAFIGPCPAGLEVDHIDGDKLNNRASNLRYVTKSVNIRSAFRLGIYKPPKGEKHWNCKLSDPRRELLLQLVGLNEWPRKEIAAVFNIHPGTVDKINRTKLGDTREIPAEDR